MADFNLTPVNQVQNAGEAESIAIDYQNWASEQALSYGELAEYQTYFEELGLKFNLTEEFKENAIL